MSARVAALLALTLAAVPARAFEQTRDKNTGVGLRWRTSSVPWFLNANRAASSPSCQASGMVDPAAAAVRASFATWEAATRQGESAPCSTLTLPYAGSSGSIAIGLGTTAEHLVVFRSGWCSANAQATADACYADATCGNKYNCFDDQGGLGRNVLALTTVMYAPSTGTIADADMEVADWGGASGTITSPPPDGWYWTCLDSSGPPACGTYGQDGCAFMDLQNTVTHEVGHFIGLAHPCESERGDCTAAMVPTTMYPSAAPREIEKRTLDRDDVEGICTIYAVSQPITGGGDGGGGGCGAGGATPGGLVAVAFALGLLRLRRRAGRRA